MPVHLQLCRSSISLSATPAARSSAVALAVIVLVSHQRRILLPKLVVIGFDFATVPTAVWRRLQVLTAELFGRLGLSCSKNAPF